MEECWVDGGLIGAILLIGLSWFRCLRLSGGLHCSETPLESYTFILWLFSSDYESSSVAVRREISSEGALRISASKTS